MRLGTWVISPTSDASSLVWITSALTLDLRPVAFSLHITVTPSPLHRIHPRFSTNVHICLLYRSHDISVIFFTPTRGPECMLNGMNTDQMYVVDAFLILYRARSVFFNFIFFFVFMAPFPGLVEWDGNGFPHLWYSLYEFKGTAECVPFQKGGEKTNAWAWALEDGWGRGDKLWELWGWVCPKDQSAFSGSWYSENILWQIVAGYSSIDVTLFSMVECLFSFSTCSFHCKQH